MVWISASLVFREQLDPKWRSNLPSVTYPQMVSATSVFPARNPSPGRPDNYVKSYTSRQSRYDARADRRFNDWFLFGIATPLLWLEGTCSADIEVCAPYGEDVIVELWP